MTPRITRADVSRHPRSAGSAKCTQFMRDSPASQHPSSSRQALANAPAGGDAGKRQPEPLCHTARVSAGARPIESHTPSRRDRARIDAPRPPADRPARRSRDLPQRPDRRDRHLQPILQLRSTERLLGWTGRICSQVRPLGAYENGFGRCPISEYSGSSQQSGIRVSHEPSPNRYWLPLTRPARAGWGAGGQRS